MWVKIVCFLILALQDWGYCFPQYSGGGYSTEPESTPDNCLCPNDNHCAEESNCHCLPGFTGKGEDCNDIHILYVRTEGGIKLCTRENCCGNGDCLLNADGYSCSCGFRCGTELKTSLFSISSEIPLCTPECTGHIMCEIPLACLQCSQNRACVWSNDTQSYMCECPAGYGGEDCEVVATTVQTDMYAYYTTDMLVTTVWGATDLDVVSGLAGAAAAPVLVVAVLMLVMAALAFWKVRRKKRSKVEANKVHTLSSNTSRGSSTSCTDTTNIGPNEVVLKEPQGLNIPQDIIQEQLRVGGSVCAVPIPTADTAHYGKDITYPNIDEISGSVQLSSDIQTVYTDHIIMTFDANGGTHSLDGCTLIIPEGAIPEDQVIAIRIGVSICTDLMSYLPRGLKPVSPIVQLCVLSDPKFKFTKNVTVQITHCLDISTEENVKEMNVHFLKSSHNLPCFHTTDGCETFTPHTHHGTLSTDHFCSFCIAADKTSVDASRVWYYLMSVIPKKIVERKWDVILCVTLYTCSRVVEKQFSPASYEVRKVKLFKFLSVISSEQYIKIHFKRELVSGWNLALQTDDKILSSEVDYTQIEASVLQRLEEDGVYPPRYVINISGNNATKSDTLTVNFSGSLKPFSAEVMLELLPPVFHAPPLPPPSYDVCHGSVSGTQSLPNLTAYQEVMSPASPRTPGLHSAPTHLELMNRVAVNTPTKWREIGLQLGLSPSDLELIEARHARDCNRCFSSVFSRWEKQLSMPYTWSTIVLALEAPLVGENRLAQEIKCTFTPRARRESSNTVGSVYSDTSSGFGSTGLRDSSGEFGQEAACKI